MELSIHALLMGMHPGAPCWKCGHLEDIERGHPDREAHRRYIRSLTPTEVSVE